MVSHVKTSIKLSAETWKKAKARSLELDICLAELIERALRKELSLSAPERSSGEGLPPSSDKLEALDRRLSQSLLGHKR